MTRALEFLDEALQEAEESARWYAERSETAAVAFAEELDSAIAHIRRTPTTLAETEGCRYGPAIRWYNTNCGSAFV